MLRTGPDEVSINNTKFIISYEGNCRNAFKDPRNCNVEILRALAHLIEPEEHRNPLCGGGEVVGGEK